MQRDSEKFLAEIEKFTDIIFTLPLFWFYILTVRNNRREILFCQIFCQIKITFKAPQIFSKGEGLIRTTPKPPF